jgi:hypothetical protein
MLTTMLMIVLLSMTACGKTKLDLSEGMVVVFDGADGSGRADLDFPDNDGTPNYVNTILKSKKVNATDMMTWIVIDDAITYDIEPISNLSNGDTVTVTISVKESVLENLGFSAKPYKKTFTVKGLTEVITVDAFENFDVSFSGISPNVTVEFAKNQNIGDVTVYYSRETNSSLKDGDTFEISAKLSDSQYYRLKETSKTFTVSGVDKYITSSEELLPETMDAMREKADRHVAEWIQAKEGYFHYYGFDFVGYQVWNRREGNMGRPNAVYLYYRINANDGTSDFPFYYYVTFENILLYANGVQEVDVNQFGRASTPGLYTLFKEYSTLESRTGEAASKYGSNYEISSFFSN